MHYGKRGSGVMLLGSAILVEDNDFFFPYFYFLATISCSRVLED